MPLTASPLPARSLAVNAGVIEEARNRQRRQRTKAGALAVLIVATAIAAIAWPSGGGLGRGQPRGSVGLPGRSVAASHGDVAAAPTAATPEARAQLAALVTRYFMVIPNGSRPAS